MQEKRVRPEGIFAYFKKQKSIVIIIILLALALLLLLMPEKKQSSSPNTNDRLAEYEVGIEQKIQKLCSCVKGAYDVKVSVYLDSGFETVYAYNEETKSNANGGNTEKKYVTVGSGSDESMVCLLERMPSISGVAIVCRGGGNPIVANEIINMISAVFNLPKNKIYVTEGKN